MKYNRLSTMMMGGLVLVACGSDPSSVDSPVPTEPTPTNPTPPTPITSYHAGLQTSGAIGFTATNDQKTRLEFSAPITPRTDVLYSAEGAKYPTTPQDEAMLSHSASLTYKYLRSQCLASYPDITVPTSDEQELTALQLDRNYNEIAKCAYEKFTAKPYWIPQLVDDVDICAAELGADWRLPTEADFALLTAADFDFLSSTLTEVTSGPGMVAGANTWGSYYFSLSCYVRGTDGTLKIGNLASGATARVTALGVATGQYKYHLEHSGSPLTLRCVRRTKLS